MRSCEGTGKNIEQAIENALFELRASREDVDIKILNEGGFLKKAKVLVSISEDAIEKYEKKDKLKKSLLEERNDEDFAEEFIKQKINSTKETKKEEKQLEKDEKKEQKAEEKAEKKEQKAEKKENKVKIFADEEISSAVAEAKSDKPQKEKKLTGEEFLNGVLSALELEGNIEKSEDEKFVRFSLTGENLNDLIGHHGECMLSLSYLMNSVCKTEDRKRVVLDVEHYRQKREESLTALAHRIADKVAKSGRYYKLEPMDASERKVIHTALQEDDRVTTLSKGEDPRRYLIVFPKEYSDRD